LSHRGAGASSNSLDTLKSDNKATRRFAGNNNSGGSGSNNKKANDEEKRTKSLLDDIKKRVSKSSIRSWQCLRVGVHHRLPLCRTTPSCTAATNSSA
jgi:hypothetical protein